MLLHDSILRRETLEYTLAHIISEPHRGWQLSVDTVICHHFLTTNSSNILQCNHTNKIHNLGLFLAYCMTLYRRAQRKDSILHIALHYITLFNHRFILIYIYILLYIYILYIYIIILLYILILVSVNF